MKSFQVSRSSLPPVELSIERAGVGRHKVRIRSVGTSWRPAYGFEGDLALALNEAIVQSEALRQGFLRLLSLYEEGQDPGEGRTIESWRPDWVRELAGGGQ